MTVTVSQLFVYPVKGLKGVGLDSAQVTDRGLEHDRRFMVVDSSGAFLTQRGLPRMATVWTEIAAGELRLAAPDCDEVALPIEPSEGEPMRVTVWESTCEAIAPSPDADRWLTNYLGLSCRLAYMPESTHRLSNAQYAGPDRLVGFADGFAFLVASEASLADLNGRLVAPVPMDRFRANVVLRGAQPFEEDSWQGFSAGSASFRMAKPCGRCQVTTTDQSTGEITGTEPLATLAAYRGSAEFGARFGMNAVMRSTGKITVGDLVTRIDGRCE